MNTINHNEDEERIDALDHLIFRELGQQDTWRQTMQQWEERQRQRQQQRRYRLIPVLSNIASVAALFILGLIVEAMVPNTQLFDSINEAQPTPPVEVESQAETAPTDSIGIED